MEDKKMMQPTVTLKSSVSTKPVSNAEQKKALFDAYVIADEQVAAAKAAYDAALAKRSDVVKEIHDLYGKGPFNFRGGVTVVIRKNNTTKQLTYFFRERSKKELEDIDE